MKKFQFLLITAALLAAGEITAQPLTGVKNIPGDYATLQLALQTLNSQGVGTGGVTINLLAGTPQTAPAGGYVIGNSGNILTTTSAARQVIIQGNGNTITSPTTHTAGSTTDAVFKVIGADWITITNFVMVENAANTVFEVGTNKMTEFGIGVFTATATNGSQNNTYQNNTISLNRSYPNSFGIFSTSNAATTAAGSNSNMKVYGNQISNVNFGVVCLGSYTPAAMDAGTDIGGSSPATGNTITNWGGSLPTFNYTSLGGINYCIFQNHQVGSSISNNNISTTSTAPILLGACAIVYSLVQPAGSFTLNLSNNNISITANAIDLNLIVANGLNGNSGVTMNMNGNVIQNSSITGGTEFMQVIGIVNNNSVGTVNMNNNSVVGMSGPGAVRPIYYNGTSTAINMNGNTVAGLSTSGGGSQIIGINSEGSASSINMNNNSLGTATTPYIVNTAASPGNGTILGINNNNPFNLVNTAVSIQNNDFYDIDYTNSFPGNSFFINNAIANSISHNISNNRFNNISLNCSAQVTLISNQGQVNNGGSKTVDNNRIVGSFSKTAAGGSLTFYADGIGASLNGTVSNQNNDFSNISVIGATLIRGWNTQDGDASTPPVKTISNNTFRNITGGAGFIRPLSIGRGAAGSTAAGNVISNVTGDEEVTGLFIASGQILVTQATITNLTSNQSRAAGVALESGLLQLRRSRICEIQSNATINVDVIGVFNYGGTLEATNNIIGNMRGPQLPTLTNINGLYGIYAGSFGANTNTLTHNTIYLNASSTATNFGSAAVYHVSNGINNNNLTMNNNALINLSARSGTGRTVAFQRSSNNFGNYVATSNTNAFYAGTPGGFNLIYYDVTNASQTLTDYKTLMVPRDALSVTENPAFISTTCGSPNFLHLPVASASALANAGLPAGGVTVDFDNDPRDAISPDIGADEFSPGTVLSLPATAALSSVSRDRISIVGISPNPVQTTAVLRITVFKAGPMQLVISDLSGRAIIRQTVAVRTGINTIPITTGSLVSGVYNITTVDVQGEKKSVTFVKL